MMVTTTAPLRTKTRWCAWSPARSSAPAPARPATARCCGARLPRLPQCRRQLVLGYLAALFRQRGTGPCLCHDGDRDARGRGAGAVPPAPPAADAGLRPLGRILPPGSRGGAATGRADGPFWNAPAQDVMHAVEVFMACGPTAALKPALPTGCGWGQRPSPRRAIFPAACALPMRPTIRHWLRPGRRRSSLEKVRSTTATSRSVSPARVSTPSSRG